MEVNSSSCRAGHPSPVLRVLCSHRESRVVRVESSPDLVLWKYFILWATEDSVCSPEEGEMLTCTPSPWLPSVGTPYR